MKRVEMKHEITLFPTMEPNRNGLFQTHLLFVTIFGLMWISSMRFLTQDNTGPFERPLLPRTPLYLIGVFLSVKNNLWFKYRHQYITKKVIQ